MKTQNFRKSALFILYIIGFLFALRTSLPSYISSSFITGITAEKLVGIIYTTSSIFTLIAFLFIPRVLKRFGNYKTILGLSLLNAFALLGLSFLGNVYTLIASFILSGTSTTLIIFCLDIFVEHYSKDVETGRIRSFYLTSINLAWLISPFIAGLLLGNGDFWKVFLFSSSVMLPVLFLINFNLRGFHDSEYHSFPIVKTIREIKHNKNVYFIMSANFLLQFFYSWMVIYTPIYLHEYVGFNWSQIGIIFTLMLLPFVIVQIPLGWLADKKTGEKELLSIGFIIMAISTGIITLINGVSIIVWGLILFTTRVGASIIEIMSETYFFKNIDTKNANVIGLYRMMTPLAYIIGPMIATVFIFLFDIKYLFLALGFIMFMGLRYSLAIKDTK